MFAFFGVQLLISPFADYHYFHNDIFGVMTVDESKYFGFVTYAILGIYLGFNVFSGSNKNQEIVVRKKIEGDSLKYEKIGIYLIIIGYVFYLLTLVSSNFVFVSISYLRFIGSLYLLFSKSSKTTLYMLLVWIPFAIIAIKSVIFMNIIIWGLLLFCFFKLNKKVNKPILISWMIIGFAFLAILQSVKHIYRESAWDPSVKEKLSLTTLIIDRVNNLNEDQIKGIGSIINVRINQGWIISHGINNLGDENRSLSQNYIKQELLGIFLPRFIYKDKVLEGSHIKFEEFTGWELDESTAMHLGIIGDLYLNFGRNKGIVFAFILGIILGISHRYYLIKLNKYPDLLFWSVLIYFMIMRAGNEFYSIMNWYVKTGFITYLFFKFLRPFLKTNSTQIPSNSM
ncbi:MAG: hypothetical protein P8P81_05815 [Bacteroidia bacterium]|nr:hypothetical protein [Bacteroidia bacterium]